MESEEFAILCAKIAENKKAKDIIILHVANIFAITDYFVICTAESERQVQGIATEIQSFFSNHVSKNIKIEGFEQGKWALLDYVDVVIHIYLEETRQYYELENLWSDASKVSWEQSPLVVSSP